MRLKRLGVFAVAVTTLFSLPLIITQISAGQLDTAYAKGDSTRTSVYTRCVVRRISNGFICEADRNNPVWEGNQFNCNENEYGNHSLSACGFKPVDKARGNCMIGEFSTLYPDAESAARAHCTCTADNVPSTTPGMCHDYTPPVLEPFETVAVAMPCPDCN